jgi:hypothetical protein
MIIAPGNVRGFIQQSKKVNQKDVSKREKASTHNNYPLTIKPEW